MAEGRPLGPWLQGAAWLLSSSLVVCAAYQIFVSRTEPVWPFIAWFAMIGMILVLGVMVSIVQMRYGYNDSSQDYIDVLDTKKTKGTTVRTPKEVPVVVRYISAALELTFPPIGCAGGAVVICLIIAHIVGLPTYGYVDGVIGWLKHSIGY